MSFETSTPHVPALRATSRVRAPIAPRAVRELRWVGRIAVLAIIAGQLQNLAEALRVNLDFITTEVDLVTYIDDALVVVAFLMALPRLTRAAGLPVLGLGLWIVLLVLAAWRSISIASFAPGEILFMFRQVAIPAVIMLVGIVLSRREWRLVGLVVIVLGLVNVVYEAIELVFGRPIDPIEAQNGEYIGFYSGTDILTGASIDRAGGLLLNPPIMGLFLAAALAFAFHRRDLAARWPIVIALAIGLWVTGSRGGVLAGAIAVVLPWAARKFNVWVAVAAAAVVAAPFAGAIAQQEGSARHADGLLKGILDAFAYPFGRGLGYVGNHRPQDIVDAGGESLMAIPFSASGLLTVALAVVLVGTYILIINKGGDRAWTAALALGVVAAAFLAETASAVNGTIPLWLAAGLALSSTLESGHPPNLQRLPPGLTASRRRMLSRS